jgi:hypothetical protein
MLREPDIPVQATRSFTIVSGPERDRERLAQVRRLAANVTALAGIAQIRRLSPVAKSSAEMPKRRKFPKGLKTNAFVPRHMAGGNRR